ncbi:hypothetical protein A3Q56_03715 [Intoshia linei]|uniref:Uncharacterized protein n=1 Tax=Intoshia linei TaxID=1819745 RepID=A0A177B4J4_9BILA|nr:hypothetical protein A3Q56_03715 [Intoshia linei]
MKISSSVGLYLLTILLNNNKISSLSKVPLTFPTSSLKNLTLSGNFIPKLSELTFLSCLVNLKELTLFDNPIYFTESIYRINGFVHNFCKNIKVFDYMNIKNPPPSKIFNESTHSKFLNSRNRLNQTEIVENVCVSDVIDGEIESIERY